MKFNIKNFKLFTFYFLTFAALSFQCPAMLNDEDADEYTEKTIHRPSSPSPQADPLFAFIMPSPSVHAELILNTEMPPAIIDRIQSSVVMFAKIHPVLNKTTNFALTSYPRTFSDLITLKNTLPHDIAHRIFRVLLLSINREGYLNFGNIESSLLRELMIQTGPTQLEYVPGSITDQLIQIYSKKTRMQFYRYLTVNKNPIIFF